MEENKEEAVTSDTEAAEETNAGETLAHKVAPNVDSQPGNASGTEAGKRGRRAEKIGIVASDKMEKTVVVRVDRLIKHPKYRRYVRRTSKFMAHDEKGAAIGDRCASLKPARSPRGSAGALLRLCRKQRSKSRDR